MGVGKSYDSRFYILSKFILGFITIFALIASYKNIIKLSEGVMSIIICILGLIIQRYINKIQKINNEYKQYKQEYGLSTEAMGKAIWRWDDKSERIYDYNKMKELLGLESDRITFMSYYDDITGIPNRKMFTEKFQELINNNLNCKRQLAIIFFDIDNFKNINDTYGYEVGDEMLLSLCKRVENILDERHTFARFGGDEFVIAFSNIINDKEISEFLNELLLKVRKPFEVSNKKIYCTISIGVSVYPKDSNRLDILLKTADMALHRAKEEGKNRYKFFDIDISNILKRQYEIEKALRTAIENNEIFMVFQPKISIKGENVNGFEALVRWVNSELGFISPVEFIPIAEKSGLIIDLGKYIIEESFRKCSELCCSTKSNFHTAINISDIQLRDEGFISFVSEMLEKYNIPPKYIEFEITEGVIMQSVVKNIELLIELKRLGVSIALDDFGTGYSSLSYLKRLPIDVLKIDKSFVDGIGVDEKSEYIAESIIKLSHSLNLKVVAEGVETKEQLGYLNKMKCDIAQGYYFSKPEKFEIIKEMI